MRAPAVGWLGSLSGTVPYAFLYLRVSCTAHRSAVGGTESNQPAQTARQNSGVFGQSPARLSPFLEVGEIGCRHFAWLREAWAARARDLRRNATKVALIVGITPAFGALHAAWTPPNPWLGAGVQPLAWRRCFRGIISGTSAPSLAVRVDLALRMSQPLRLVGQQTAISICTEARRLLNAKFGGDLGLSGVKLTLDLQRG